MSDSPERVFRHLRGTVGSSSTDGTGPNAPVTCSDMTMEISFLGTGSAYPSPHRGASALVLRTDGDCWLFDCGEGTQTQLMKSHLRAGELAAVVLDGSPLLNAQNDDDALDVVCINSQKTTH